MLFSPWEMCVYSEGQPTSECSVEFFVAERMSLYGERVSECFSQCLVVYFRFLLCSAHICLWSCALLTCAGKSVAVCAVGGDTHGNFHLRTSRTRPLLAVALARRRKRRRRGSRGKVLSVCVPVPPLLPGH